MPVISTKGAASAQGFGFVRLSAAGGYYYSISTITQYYQPQILAVQPISTGWIVSGQRPNTERFTFTLGPTGTLLSYKQDSSNYSTTVRSMNQGGPAAFSTDDVPVQFGGGVDIFGFISSTPNYTGTPGKFANSLSNYQIMGIDYSANRLFSTAYYDDGTNIYPYIGSSNYSAGTTNWVRRWTYSPWGFAYIALIRPGDTTNVLISSTRNDGSGSKLGVIKIDKSTPAVNGAYRFSSISGDALSFITDPSGNLYFGTYNGQIARVNTSDTVDWAYTYWDSATLQNFGYTHVCFYDGYLYAIGSQHPNGNYLTRINPSDGSVEWAIKITAPFYGCYGISASQNGIMVPGEDSNSSGYKTTYLLNYPLAGGIIGTKGAFTFANMTLGRFSISTTFDSATGPTLSTQSAGSASSYSSSLSTATSILSSQTSFS